MFCAVSLYLKEANEELQLFEKSCSSALAAEEAAAAAERTDTKIDQVHRALAAGNPGGSADDHQGLLEVKERLNAVEGTLRAIARKLDDL